MNETKERSRLPEGMTLDQRTPTPNQSYDLRLNGAIVGTSEHQENWRSAKFWLFTTMEGSHRWVRQGHHHHDGAAWLKSAYQDEAEPDTAYAGSGAGYETNQKRKEAIEAYAVERITECFTPPGYQVENVGNLYLGYDLRVISYPDSQEWHIEAKGTQGACGTVEITEGEWRHNQNSCSAREDVLCVVSGITANPIGEDFECSGGTLEWVWPWEITERVSWEPGLVPVKYKYTVPALRYVGPIPPPLVPRPDPGTSTAATQCGNGSAVPGQPPAA